MRRIVSVLLMVMVWLVATNHCLIAQAFAASQSSKAPHSHCPGHESSDKSGDGSSHDKGTCDKNGCCQPALQSQDGGSIHKAIASIDPFFVSSLISVVHIPENSGVTLESFPPTHDPPSFVSDLMHSLQLAPNAPPAF